METSRSIVAASSDAMTAAATVATTTAEALLVPPNKTTVSGKTTPTVSPPNHDNLTTSISDRGPLDSQNNTTIAFPRWGDPRGINVQAILAFIAHASKHLDEHHDLMHGGEALAIPNVLYILSNQTFLYEKRRHDKLKGFLIKDRYGPIESFWKDALAYFWKHHATQHHHDQWKHLRKALTPHNNSRASAGIPFLVKLDDHRYCCHGNLHWNNQTWNVPVWTLATQVDCQYAFPVPTYTLLMFIREQEQHKGGISSYEQQNQRDYPWESKLPQAVWRGSASVYQRGDVTHLLRNRMILQASHNTTLWDVAITGKRVKGKVTGGRRVPGARVVPEKIPFRDFQKYRAILDADGNSWSERFPRLLCLNSVVLKVDPEFVEFIMPQVQPWVHYIPVKQDSSDLRNVTQWVLDPANDEQVQQIVANANQWCVKTMVYTKTMEYFLGALDVYVAQLDRFDPDWQSRWAARFEELPWQDHQWTAID